MQSLGTLCAAQGRGWAVGMGGESLHSLLIEGSVEDSKKGTHLLWERKKEVRAGGKEGESADWGMGTGNRRVPI